MSTKLRAFTHLDRRLFYRVSSAIVSNDGARVKGTYIAHLLLAAGVALAVVLATAVAQAAPFDLTGTDWEGCSDFVRLARSELGAARVIASSQVDWRALRPADALVILNPKRPVDFASAGAFVRAGGSLVLLDDFGAGDDLLLSFAIRRVPLPAHPLAALRNNPALAIAEPSAPDYPLTEHVDRVVTNHASGLELEGMRRVLEVRGAGGASVALALTAKFGKGRLLAIGDPSIVINSMLRYPGNRELARNIIREMAGPSGGHLWVAEGGFTEAGSFAGADEETASLLSTFARATASLRHEGLPSWVVYWFALVMALTILVWLLPQAARMYRPESARFTRPTPLHAQGGTAGHAAVIGAKGSSRGLAMVEWKRAFEEEATWRLGLSRTPAADELLRRVRSAGWVDADGARVVGKLLLRMAEIETMFLSHQTEPLRRIRDEEVLEAAALIEQVLKAARAAKAHAGAAA